VPIANLPSQNNAPLPVITLDEEEISDDVLCLRQGKHRDIRTRRKSSEPRLQRRRSTRLRTAQHEAVEAAQRYEAAEAAAVAVAQAAAEAAEDPAGYGPPWAGSLSANLCLCVEFLGERGSYLRLVPKKRRLALSFIGLESKKVGPPYGKRQPQ